jgi:pimeloyl-ACP methyl ester carboxylesterase
MNHGRDEFKRPAAISRRQILRLGAAAGAGLLLSPLVGCRSDADRQTTPTSVPTAVSPSGFFDSDGVRIHYETFGAGKPIVLIHGFLFNLQANWVAAGWTDALKATRLVAALDNRGHGQSGKPHDREAYAGDKMEMDVIRLMDYLNIEKADVFGYSLGGFMTLNLLARHRERFNSAIVGGVGSKGFAFSSPEFIQDIADGLLAPDASKVTDFWGKNQRDLADLVPGDDLQALAACVYHMGEPIDYDALAKVDIPVLIVVGANDTLPKDPAGLQAAIPGSKLVTIPDVDHLGAVFDERTKNAVLEFLQTQ